MLRSTISRDLHASASGLAWVLNAYSLAFAAVLIPAGRLADRYGRRRVFLLGVAGFTVFSGLCGFAPDPAVLIAGRALQGLFAALVVPTALALLLSAVPAARRAVAVATQAAMGAAAAAVGPTTGALLIEYGSWRWVFRVNVPIGVLVALAGRWLLRESRDPGARGLPDPAGVVLVAVIPALLSFSVIQGASWGWDNPWVVAGFGLAALLLPVLGWRSAAARNPALDLELLRIRQFRLINGASLLFATAFYGMLLANIVFLQTVWHYSVLEAALASAPGPLMVAVLARFAGRLAGRVGVPGRAARRRGLLGPGQRRVRARDRPVRPVDYAMASAGAAHRCSHRAHPACAVRRRGRPAAGRPLRSRLRDQRRVASNQFLGLLVSEWDHPAETGSAGQLDDTQKQERQMRFIFLVKATEDSEAAVMPAQKFVDEIENYAAQLVQAGVAVSGIEVLRPSSQGFRVAYEDGNFSMVEGPFVESKELIAAYWQIEVASKDEAIAWAKRVPFANGLVEVRPIYSAEDFG